MILKYVNKLLTFLKTLLSANHYTTVAVLLLCYHWCTTIGHYSIDT